MNLKIDSAYGVEHLSSSSIVKVCKYLGCERHSLHECYSTVGPRLSEPSIIRTVWLTVLVRVFWLEGYVLLE